MARQPAHDEHPIRAALDGAGPRPAVIGPGGNENRSAKKNWAQRFSNSLAVVVADEIRPLFRTARVTPFADGTGQEYSVGHKLDSKRTDVGVWDDAAGLVLGVSIKTLSFRDTHLRKVDGRQTRVVGRYVRNVKRNDMELRDEADILHRRQPYAVLFALLFTPRDAAWDGSGGHSSFAHMVFTLRKRTGRAGTDVSRYDLFERVFVGLYDDDGAVEFFDVANAPPRNTPPRDTLSLRDVVQLMREDFVVRNLGVGADARYAEDDPSFELPPGSLPADFAPVEVLDYEDVLAQAERDLDEDVESDD